MWVETPFEQTLTTLKGLFKGLVTKNKFCIFAIFRIPPKCLWLEFQYDFKWL